MALGLFLAGAASCPPGRAQGPVVPPDLQKAIDKAIDRGVEHLTKLQQPNGTWAHDFKGATTLAAWTLLECGVSPNDPRVRKAADFIRGAALQSDWTYELSLAILFFDKLGDPEDEPLIEALALRLLAGQNGDHGWTYNCPPLPERDQKRLQEHVAKLLADGPRKLPEKPAADAKPRDPKLVHADILKEAAAINQRPILTRDFADSSDNSNTQFAMLALWVARRHGMPVDRAFQRVEVRFRLMQHAKNGGWGYRCNLDPLLASGPEYQPTAAMTCCGLIGLALGNAVTPPKTKKVDLNEDKAVHAALCVVAANLGDTGQARAKLMLEKPGRSYYYLWTLERMAVIYGFRSIGGKEWYRWGAELLLANQQGDGGWKGDYAAGGVDTCFALLFLKKANVAQELTRTFTDKVKAPDKVPADLLDLIGRDVKPGVEMPKGPKKNAPEEVPIPEPAPAHSLIPTPSPSFPRSAWERTVATLCVAHDSNTGGRCGQE
jgi:hypothetical protein